MFKNLSVLLALVVLSLANEEEIDYYVKLISDAYENGQTYELPKNARQYYSAQKRKLFGSYDFVVIGAGATGCVVANRLSEIFHWSVLVLEAGVYGNNLTQIPNMYTPVEFTSYNWGYNSTPQTTACLGLVDQICPYPRGKGVGGSTLINGLVYARGYKYDFDQWEKLSGDERWGYHSALNYFKKSENFVHNDPDAPFDPAYHGENGYLRVEYHKPRSPQLNAFIQANQELGYEHADYNANKLGVSQSQLNTKHGRRFDSATAFLKPVLHRKNLKVLTESYVTKVRFDKKGVATGVEFTRQGKNYVVRVKKEVILSAGAIATPQILMLSGVGPKKHLQDLKIDVVADLEVGSTLLDNSFIPVNVGSNYTEPIKPLRDYVEEYLNGEGPFAIPNSNQGVGFYESSYSNGTGSPDIELEFIPANATGPLSQRSTGLTEETFEDTWKYNNVAQSFLVYVICLHCVSSGTVRLKSNNPYDYPLIDSKFISDPDNKDINLLYEGIQLLLKLLNTKAFKAIDAKPQGGPLRTCKQFEYLSKDYWYCALRQLTINLYHPLGSCPMGKNPKKGAVVDSHMRVFGFKNMRIADASVFPLALAGHPNAPCVMVGEQLGDLVKLTYKKEIDRWKKIKKKRYARLIG